MYVLSVEIKDEALYFLYARYKAGWLDQEQEERLTLEAGLIENGMIKKEAHLKTLLIQWLEEKQWYPERTSILIEPWCVLRRMMYMPPFMEKHIEAYLTTYPDLWIEKDLSKYLFTAHQLSLVNAYEAHYCLIGSMKDAVMKPYHLFKELKCTPSLISTPLDVALYTLQIDEIDGHHMLLLETAEGWHIGIYEKQLCVFNFICPSSETTRFLIELHKVFCFHTMKYKDKSIQKCYIMYQSLRKESLELEIQETFDLEVIYLENTVHLNSLMMAYEKQGLKRRVR